MMYYSPGVDYLCPRCESSSVRFIFDEKCRGWFEAMKLIRSKKVKLSNLYQDYVDNPRLPKWTCQKCYDCGIVYKKSYLD